MATTTVPPNPADQSRSLAKAGSNRSVKDLLVSPEFKDQVALALPRHLRPDRFVRVALNATLRQPELLQCQKESLFLALLQLAAYGIEADGRRAHLIPFWDTKICECGHPLDQHQAGKCMVKTSRGPCSCTVAKKRRLVQLILDYKGIAELVRRSGDVAYIHADVVLEGDDWDFQFGSAAFLRHKPNLSLEPYDSLHPEKRRILAVYSFVKLKDGSEDFIVISKSDVDAVRRRSKSPNAGPWVSDYPEMAKKTAFRRHSKWLPLSPETRDAVESDDEEPTLSAGVILDGLTGLPIEDPEEAQPETLADRIAKATQTPSTPPAVQSEAVPAQDAPPAAPEDAQQPEEPPEDGQLPLGDPPQHEPQRRRGRPRKVDTVVASLKDHADWDAAEQSEDWGHDFLKVGGEIFQFSEGSYRKYQG